MRITPPAGLRQLRPWNGLLGWLLFGWIWLPPETVAQHQVAFKRYTVQDGLSNNYIRQIGQDSEGFIWLATQEGLNRFDSYTFRVYHYLPNDSTSLTNHPITNLEEDRYHNLWIATWGGGVFVYNRQLDNFRRLRLAAGKREGIASVYVHELMEDSRGRMWVGSNEGLDLVDLRQNTYQHFRHRNGDPKSLGNNQVMSIAEDRHANLWIGMVGGGLDHFNPETGVFEHYTHRDEDPRSLSHNDVYCVFYDQQHRLWVGTSEAGLNLMENPADGFTHFRSGASLAKGLPSNQVWAIAESQEGQIWVGTDNGLALYNGTDKSFSVYRNDPFDSKSLPGNSVKSLYVDQQGRLWAGTVNNGIGLFDKQLTQLGHYYQKMSGPSLSFNDVSAFLEDRQGKVLIGTDGGGLNLFERATSDFKAYHHDYRHSESIGSDKIKALLMDRKQRIWIGFWGAGLDYFDPHRRVFTHYNKETLRPEGRPSSDNVTCLAEDQSGYLWLGTFGGGLNKFDPERRTFQAYTHDANDASSLSDRNIWVVLVDREDNVWAGTSNGRLDLFDRKRGNFIHIPMHGPQENGYRVQALFEDSKGRIWIGLGGGGLKLLNKKNRTFQTFTSQHGLPSNNINSIKETSNGMLWLGTNNGIVRFDPETGRSETYGISEGAQGLHFNQGASGILASGELLFGGNNGFNLFHPDSLKDRQAKVPLVLTDFQVFNREVPIGKEGSPLRSPINQTPAIELSYQQSVFSIEYAGLNYTSPEKIQYRYRLKGFVDESWQLAGNTRKVTYTNLEPDTYLFEVTTVPNHYTTAAVRTLAITVMPPWWKTGWFRLTAALLGLGAVYAGYQIKAYRVVAKNRVLEAKVAERTQEIEVHRDSLKRLNAEISQQNGELERRVDERTRELQASEAQLRLIADALPVLITYVDREERYRFNNKTYEDWFGIARSQVYGKHLSEIMGQAAYRKVKALVQRALLGEAVHVESWLPYPRKGNLFVSIDYIPHFQEGQVLGYYALVLDITDNKKARQQLEKALQETYAKNEELRRTNVDLDNFVYMASHDLKAPLANLEGFYSILAKRLEKKLDEKEADMLNMIQVSTMKLKTTIQDLTEITRVQKEIEEGVELVSFQEVLEDVKISIEPLIAQSKADIVADFSVEAIYYARKNLRSIIYNLVSNAIKYQAPDRTPRIVIQTRRQEKFILLSVEDNGLGIPTRQFSKLFSMFKRLHTHVEGSGIGLYITKRIIENNGGTIKVESQEGKGTLFNVFFKA